MAREFSPDFKKDPTRARPRQERYTEKILPLFENFKKRIMADFEKAAEGKAVHKVGKPIQVDPGTFFPHMDKTIEDEILDPGAKAIEKEIPDDYNAGRAFGSIALGSSPEERRRETGKIGALIEGNKGSLKGITDETAKQIRQTITDGLVNEKEYKDLARDIVDRIDKIGIIRATAMAHYESQRAVTIGIEDRYKEDGVEEVEWLACADDKTCDECADLDGNTYPIEDHPPCPHDPYCRCTLLPVIKIPEET